jgi:hypothetical protein
VEWQAGIATPDPNSPGNYVRDVSACYRYPAVGGVYVIDDNVVSPYQISANDSGQILVVNTTGAITLELPDTAPAFDSPAQGVWNVEIVNIGTGAVTLDPNGLNLDGSGSTVTINTGEGRRVSTDGTDYYSGLIVSASGGGFTSPMTTLGDLIYEDGTPAAARLAGNTTATRKFLRQTGTGSISAAPAWDVLVAGDIPNIAESQVTSLVSDLALKAPLASPTLTGTPAAPTAAVDTNTTQLATTAFVIGQAASATPIVESGSGAVGTSTRFARGDHVHPKSSPLTTKGDVYTRSGSADDRLPVGADGTALFADSTATDGIAWKPISALLNIGQGLLFAHYADAGNVTTGETDLYSDSIPGGTLSTAGTAICARYGGIFVNSSSTKDLRVYFGGSLIFDSGALTTSAATSWDISVMIVSESATVIRATVSATLTGASTSAFATTTRLTGLTLSGSTTLKITGQAGGSGPATNDIVAKEGLGWLPAGSLQLVIGFVIADGTIGVGVGPVMIAPHSGKLTVCKIVVNSSDPSISLQIKIKQNGVDVFSADPSVSAGSTQGTVATTTLLTSNPLSVAQNDVFTIDVVNGSSLWKFTAQLET